MEGKGCKVENEDNDKILMNIHQILLISNKYTRVSIGMLCGLFFMADQLSLARAGVVITGNRYLLKDTPVPELIYDLLTNSQYHDLIKPFFDIKDGYVYPNQKADLNELSFLAINVINTTVRRYRYYSVKQLNEKIKKYVPKYFTPGCYIPHYIIAKSGGAIKEMLDYIKYQDEINRLLE